MYDIFIYMNDSGHLIKDKGCLIHGELTIPTIDNARMRDKLS